jgi:hypothetical protein
MACRELYSNKTAVYTPSNVYWLNRRLSHLPVRKQEVGAYIIKTGGRIRGSIIIHLESATWGVKGKQNCHSMNFLFVCCNTAVNLEQIYTKLHAYFQNPAGNVIRDEVNSMLSGPLLSGKL